MFPDFRMSDSFSTWVRKGVAVFFEYDTPRIVHIKSKKVGVISRFVQFCILTYIIGYVIVYQKGYQEFDTVEAAVTTKVKGVAFTNFTDEELVGVPQRWKHLYRRVWDVTDYVIPPSENEAFFVTTNVILTPNQTLGKCPEDPFVQGAVECDPRNPEDVCVPGASLPLGHGVNTGACVPNDNDFIFLEEGSDRPPSHVCEILAWCPVERDKKPLGDGKALLAQQAQNFTVLIKNQIEFPKYGMRRTNILESSNTSYLSSCTYNNETDPFCPVFRLGQLVSDATGGKSFDEVAADGAVISVGVRWDCDLDWDFMQYCRPEYRFRRLDNPESKIAPGWNFRHAQYFSDSQRTLYKAYGILFVMDVSGTAGKFSPIPLVLTFGAGLALLSVATVVCDLIVLYLMKDRVVYRDKKYLLVKGSDAYNVYRNQENDSYQEIRSHHDLDSAEELRQRQQLPAGPGEADD